MWQNLRFLQYSKKIFQSLSMTVALEVWKNEYLAFENRVKDSMLKFNILKFTVVSFLEF